MHHPPRPAPPTPPPVPLPPGQHGTHSPDAWAGWPAPGDISYWPPVGDAKGWAFGPEFYGPHSCGKGKFPGKDVGCGKGDWGKGDRGKGDWGKGDWGKGDWGKGDWGKIDWGKGDWGLGAWGKDSSGKGESGKGEMVKGKFQAFLDFFKGKGAWPGAGMPGKGFPLPDGNMIPPVGFPMHNFFCGKPGGEWSWKGWPGMPPQIVPMVMQPPPQAPKDEVLERFVQRLRQAVQKSAMREGVQVLLEMRESGKAPPMDLLRGLLQAAAALPGFAIFGTVLQCCTSAGLKLDPQEYTSLLGKLLSRNTSLAQCRLVLNMALPRGAKPLPLVPDDLEIEEREFAFLDAEAAAVLDKSGKAVPDDPEDEEDQYDVAAGEDNEEWALEAQILEFSGCEVYPELNGQYRLAGPMHEKLMHERPVYVKAGESNSKDPSEDEPDMLEDVHAYFWEDDGDMPWQTGWYLGTSVPSADPLAYNPCEGPVPPKRGWQVFLDGQRGRDPGAFDLPGAEERKQRLLEKERRKAYPTSDEVEQLVSKLDLSNLQGSLVSKIPGMADYFGHFVVLLHLERLTELGQYRRRLIRHPPERLVRQGRALEGLQAFDTFGKKQTRHGVLPGWTDKGRECVAFWIPWGTDVERLKFRKGDAVVISNGDPFRGRLGEGVVEYLDGKKLVVDLMCQLPEDGKKTKWRVDAWANRIVYERQLTALLRLATQEKPDPLCELLVAGGVGQLDAWAKKHMEPPWRAEKAMRLNKFGKKTKLQTRQQEKGKAEEKKNKPQQLCETLARKDPRADLSPELVAKHGAMVAEALEEASNLNSSQRGAVMDAVSRRCTIVQGPPGTGKTHVAVKVMQLWVKKMRLYPVLATSDSNTAVDNMAEGLHRAGVRVVRLGRPEKLREDLDQIALDTIMARMKKEKSEKKEKKDAAEKAAVKPQDDDDDDWGNWGNGGDEDEDEEEQARLAAEKAAAEAAASEKAAAAAAAERAAERNASNHPQTEHQRKLAQRKEDFAMRREILKDAEVICVTTISSGGDILKDFKFQAMLVDEVAQATELSVIVPVALRGAMQLVLVGDHCQLPPAVLSREAELRGLSLSLYGRLADCGLEPCFLDTQYRSHPKLAEFSARCFYNGHLNTGIESSARPMPKGIKWPNPDVPVAFFEVSAPESFEGESKANPEEVERITEFVLGVLEAGELGPEDIGVVTPYMAQVRSLRKALRDRLPESQKRLLEIASVDNFQGREKELIVFSAVRSNRRGIVGFLGDWRRLNVMLTRARRGLVVFGNAKTLQHDCYWQQWLEWCQEVGVMGNGAARASRRKKSQRDRVWKASRSRDSPRRSLPAGPKELPMPPPRKRKKKEAAQSREWDDEEIEEEEVVDEWDDDEDQVQPQRVAPKTPPKRGSAAPVRAKPSAAPKSKSKGSKPPAPPKASQPASEPGSGHSPSPPPARPAGPPPVRPTAKTSSKPQQKPEAKIAAAKSKSGRSVLKPSSKGSASNSKVEAKDAKALSKKRSRPPSEPAISGPREPNEPPPPAPPWRSAGGGSGPSAKGGGGGAASKRRRGSPWKEESEPWIDDSEPWEDDSDEWFSE